MILLMVAPTQTAEPLTSADVKDLVSPLVLGPRVPAQVGQASERRYLDRCGAVREQLLAPSRQARIRPGWSGLASCVEKSAGVGVGGSRELAETEGSGWVADL